MNFQKNKEKILIIDFGSQLTKLIARRIRDIGAYSEVLTPKQISKLEDFDQIKGIILSGGPSTVTKKKYESIPKNIRSKNTYFGYLLWIATYFKDIWWKNKIIK